MAKDKKHPKDPKEPKENKELKEKKTKHEKAVKPEKAEKKVKKEKAKDRPKVAGQPAAPQGGIQAVEVVSLQPGEPASCGFDPATGRLTLRIPMAMAGPAGPQGPQGIPGRGLDFSKVFGCEDDFSLFIDEDGRLGYSALGAVSFVSLTPGDAPVPAEGGE
jgi:hypothetical protein